MITAGTLLAAGWQSVEDDSFVGHLGSVYTLPAKVLELGVLTKPHHQNLSGVVHGGVYMTGFDRAMGYVVRDLRKSERFATAQMSVEFLRAAKIGEFVRFVPEITKQGRQAVFMRGVAWVEDKQVAAASAVFMKVA